MKLRLREVSTGKRECIKLEEAQRTLGGLKDKVASLLGHTDFDVSLNNKIALHGDSSTSLASLGIVSSDTLFLLRHHTNRDEGYCSTNHSSSSVTRSFNTAAPTQHSLDTGWELCQPLIVVRPALPIKLRDLRSSDPQATPLLREAFALAPSPIRSCSALACVVDCLLREESFEPRISMLTSFPVPRSGLQVAPSAKPVRFEPDDVGIVREVYVHPKRPGLQFTIIITDMSYAHVVCAVVTTVKSTRDISHATSAATSSAAPDGSIIRVIDSPLSLTGYLTSTFQDGPALHSFSSKHRAEFSMPEFVYNDLAGLSMYLRNKVVTQMVECATEALGAKPEHGYFGMLPPELLLQVAGYMDVGSLCNMQATARVFGAPATNNTLWKRLYEERFGNRQATLARDAAGSSGWKQTFGTKALEVARHLADQERRRAERGVAVRRRRRDADVIGPHIGPFGGTGVGPFVPQEPFSGAGRYPFAGGRARGPFIT